MRDTPELVGRGGREGCETGGRKMSGRNEREGEDASCGEESGGTIKSRDKGGKGAGLEGVE